MTAPRDLAQELKPRVEALESERTTFRQVAVTAVHKTTSTYDGDVEGIGLVEGLPAAAAFLPKVGDVLRLPLNGSVPGFEPGRIGEGAVGGDELADEVTQQIATAYDTASGKNQVTFAYGPPTTPGTRDGDLWFQRDGFGLGVVVGTWEWVFGAWSPRTYGDQVLASLTVGKIVGGTATFDMLMAGSIYSAASGSRYRIDATGIKLYSGSSTTPTVDLNAVTGNATFRGTVEGALIRTSATGQRLEIEGGGTAGGRTMTFYPATGTGVATVTSRDDGAGNAGITLKAGGAARGFLNFNSSFADIGYGNDTSASSWLRANPGTSTFGLEMTSTSEIASTTPRTRWFEGAYTYAILSRADGLNKVGKFSLLGPPSTGAGSDVSAFSFGQLPGASDADVYALRFISTNPGATGGFVYFSDRRLKKNVKAASFDALAEVVGAPVVEFEWRETGERSFGFAAQDMPLDMQVQLSPDQPIAGVSNPVGISMEQGLAKAWKAVQQMYVRVVALETELASIRGRAK